MIYYPAYKGVPVIKSGNIQLTYDAQGIRYFYYAWNAISGGGRAYTEQEVCSIREAVNKFERSLPYTERQAGAVRGRCVQQVYICDREPSESWLRQIFTGDGAYEKRSICPGWTFCSDDEQPLKHIYKEIKAIK